MLPQFGRAFASPHVVEAGYYLARASSSLRGFASAAPSGTAAAAPQATAGSQQQQQQAPSGPPKLVVFGGRGFVGSEVCKEALKTGLHVVSITPSGTPPLHKEAWTQDVEWARGNALEPRTYEQLLPGALAAISCVGGFGSQSEMQRINGTANAAAIAAAKAAGVPRFVYVSAHTPNVPGIDLVLAGYIKGKQQAEEELFRSYPNTGVALRPWIIYGDRALSPAITLPLGAVFGPVDLLLKKLPPAQAKQLAALPVVGAGFVPPVSVHQVAKVAVAAATDPSISGGVIDDWQIRDWN